MLGISRGSGAKLNSERVRLLKGQRAMESRPWLYMLLYVALTSPFSATATATEIPKRAVLAHYMVCCPKGGLSSTIQDYESEIEIAERAGIDGFVLNAGHYARYPANLAVVERIYEAARSHRNFGLIFSFDQSSVEESVHIIAKYANWPNTMTKDGNIVVSGWAQSAAWAKQVRQELAARGLRIFLAPQMRYSLLPQNSFLPKEYSDEKAAIAALKEAPLDGYFYFGAGSRSPEILKGIRTVAAAVHSHGKLFMCGISPFYRGLQSNARVFESDGFSGMRDRWLEAIRSGADWVQLVTWNDWSESTYLQPFDQPLSNVWQLPNWQHLPEHGAFLRASRYYIDWFKSGRQPPIVSETLFYFYQLHPRDAEGIIDFRTMARGRPRFWDEMTDRFHLASFLQKPLSLAIRIGQHSYSLELPAGDSVTSIPLGLGSISIALSVDGRELHEELPIPVRSNADIGNFNYLSGELNVRRSIEIAH